jgi:acyl-coenzyme A thioesterase PaaI-like protein
MTQRPHPVTRLTRTARGMRLAANMWPPLLFAGIRVEHIAADFRHVRVRLAKSPLTANYFGTQFGGSMFAMTDPFWMVMLARNLGPDYTVWDQRAEIEFVTPGRTALALGLLAALDRRDGRHTVRAECSRRWGGAPGVAYLSRARRSVAALES